MCVVLRSYFKCKLLVRATITASYDNAEAARAHNADYVVEFVDLAVLNNLFTIHIVLIFTFTIEGPQF